MKIKTPILIFLIAFLMSSCGSDEELFEYDLTGNWIPTEYSDSLIVADRSEQLDYDKQGFIFKKDGKLVRRETLQVVDDTPVAFWDFDGSWAISDSIVSIKIERWEGTETSLWKLKPIDKNTLRMLKLNKNK